MWDGTIIAFIGFTFFLAGLVKGVIGLGLPTVSLALLTAAIGLSPAMALLLAPSLLTNVWQAFTGGNGRAILRRLWPFFLMATVTVWIGALALTRVDASLLSALLGLLIIAYGTVNLSGFRLSIAAGHERSAGVATGLANGVLTGMTGSFVVPGVMYLQAIGLPRDMLVQAMGILFSLSTLALALALGGNGLLDAQLGLMSLAAVVPALIGMVAGQWAGRRMSEKLFRKVFFASLVAMGAYIVARAVGVA